MNKPNPEKGDSQGYIRRDPENGDVYQFDSAGNFQTVIRNSPPLRSPKRNAKSGHSRNHSISLFVRELIRMEEKNGVKSVSVKTVFKMAGISTLKNGEFENNGRDSRLGIGFKNLGEFREPFVRTRKEILGKRAILIRHSIFS